MDHLTLIGDASALEDLISKIQEARDAGKISLEQVRKILLKLRSNPSEMICVNLDPGLTPGTNERRVTFEPSKGLLDLVATLTGDIDHGIIK